MAGADGAIVVADAPPSLATAGSGDVLSGSIGALLAQGLSGPDAAALAVFVGCRAAERVSGQYGTLGLVAGDLPWQSPRSSTRSRRWEPNMAPGTEPTVRDVMRREVPVASTTTPIAELARLMVEHRVPGLPVIGHGELVGIVTEADLIQREANVDMPSIVTFLDAVIVADAGTPFEEELRRVVATTAEELMTSPVISIRDSATVAELATLMLQQRINPVPVVDDASQIVGLATRSGLIELIARLESAARHGRRFLAGTDRHEGPGGDSSQSDLGGIRATRAIIDLDAMSRAMCGRCERRSPKHPAHGRRQGRRVRSRRALGGRVALNAGAHRAGRCHGQRRPLLRASGISAPIVLLGSIDPAEVPRRVAGSSSPSRGESSSSPSNARQGGFDLVAALVHFKVDTGLASLWCIARLRRLTLARRIADDSLLAPCWHLYPLCIRGRAGEPFTTDQLRRFRPRDTDAIASAGVRLPPLHAANSAGILTGRGVTSSGTRWNRSLRAYRPRLAYRCCPACALA